MNQYQAWQDWYFKNKGRYPLEMDKLTIEELVWLEVFTDGFNYGRKRE
jgi:hypothetical protein